MRGRPASGNENGGVFLADMVKSAQIARVCIEGFATPALAFIARPKTAGPSFYRRLRMIVGMFAPLLWLELSNPRTATELYTGYAVSLYVVVSTISQIGDARKNQHMHDLQVPAIRGGDDPSGPRALALSLAVAVPLAYLSVPMGMLVMCSGFSTVLMLGAIGTQQRLQARAAINQMHESEALAEELRRQRGGR